MFKLTIANNSQTFGNFDSMMQEIASRHSSDSYYAVGKVANLIAGIKENLSQQIQQGSYNSKLLKQFYLSLAELEELDSKLSWESSTWVVMDYHNLPGNQALFIPEHTDYIQIGDYFYQIDEL